MPNLPSAIVDVIVEPGPLEAQAHLCLASLKLFLEPAGFEINVHCRSHLIDKLDPLTQMLFTHYRLKLLPIENPFHDGYGAGNKIVVSAIEKDAPFRLFLDTDTVVLKHIDPQELFKEKHVCAVPESRLTYRHPTRIWQELYATLDLKLPEKDFALGTGRLFFPYFNAGVVAMPEGFGARWLDAALAIDSNSLIPNKRPWLDQISLPVAICSDEDISYFSLYHHYNCVPRNHTKDVSVLHYHALRTLGRFPKAASDVNAILEAANAPIKGIYRLARTYEVKSQAFIQQALVHSNSNFQTK